MDIQKIVINKNRGWRGLAEVKCNTNDGHTEVSQIFSFSQDVWDDMLKGVMVLPDQDDYLIVHFNNTEALPKGQRSVLLKNFMATVTKVKRVPKNNWTSETRGTSDYNIIANFLTNKNNHTTSDWNCIGIRVIPEI